MLYGFDIGGTKIEMGIFDDALTPLWTKRIATPTASYTAFLTSIITLIKQADSQFSPSARIGIGIPGLIDHQRSIYSANIPVINQHSFAADLEQAIQRSIVINNDANCFALAEAYHADFRSYQTILALVLGTGLGGGLVINHRVVSGLNGCAGEIGHSGLPINALTILGKDTPILTCGCGLVGCAEPYLSGRGFEWLYQHFYRQSISAPMIIERYYQGDPKAKQHVERYTELLAAYLGHLMMIIDAELIVIGGGLSNFDELYHAVPERMARYLLPRMTTPLIAKARYGDSGGTRGAALLGLQSSLPSLT